MTQPNDRVTPLILEGPDRQTPECSHSPEGGHVTNGLGPSATCAGDPTPRVEYENHGREVWHVDDRYPMRHLPDRLTIEDGSVLGLYECTYCAVRAFVGLDAKRCVVVRAATPLGPPTDGSPTPEDEAIRATEALLRQMGIGQPEQTARDLVNNLGVWTAPLGPPPDASWRDKICCVRGGMPCSKVQAWLDAGRVTVKSGKSCDCANCTLWRAPLGPAQPTPATVGGYDAAFWSESYYMLRDAVANNLQQFVQDGEESEESISVRAIERAGADSRGGPPDEPGEECPECGTYATGTECPKCHRDLPAGSHPPEPTLDDARNENIRATTRADLRWADVEEKK